MPATVIHKSNPSPPVRIYAGKKICEVDGSCEQLSVIISEFMPQWDVIKPLVDNIMEWSNKRGCDTIVSLEGTHAVGEKKGKVLVHVYKNEKDMKRIETENALTKGLPKEKKPAEAEAK